MRRNTDEMTIHNADVCNPPQSKSVATYDDAAKHAESAYWVDPIQIEDESGDQNFHKNFRAADFGQSGKVHYERRK